jgi:hypothetical protein
MISIDLSKILFGFWISPKFWNLNSDQILTDIYKIH